LPPGPGRQLASKLGGTFLAQAHRPQRLAALDRQHVRHVALLQPAEQPSVTAVDLVAGHPGDRDLGLQRPLQHALRQLRLGAEADRIWDGSRSAARPIAEPALGQVQLPIDQGMSVAAGIGQEHPDLAVLDPPGRAGVLPLDPSRVGALLEEPGLVHHQHRARVTQVLHDVAAEIIADLVGVPAGVVEQSLHPIWGRRAGLLGQLPAVLALDTGKQATQERSCPTADLHAVEPRRDPLAQRL
jgi:hypothetical protein